MTLAKLLNLFGTHILNGDGDGDGDDDDDANLLGLKEIIHVKWFIPDAW